MSLKNDGIEIDKESLEAGIRDAIDEIKSGEGAVPGRLSETADLAKKTEGQLRTVGQSLRPGTVAREKR